VKAFAEPLDVGTAIQIGGIFNAEVRHRSGPVTTLNMLN
jgi:hypothetical protein